MTQFRIYELMLDCRKMGHKVTQKDLAAAAGIGQTAIHKIIHGQTKSPSPQVLLAIADYFTKALGQKITIDDLIDKKRLESSSTSPAVGNIDVDTHRKIGQEDYVWLPPLRRNPLRRSRSGGAGGTSSNTCRSRNG